MYGDKDDTDKPKKPEDNDDNYPQRFGKNYDEEVQDEAPVPYTDSAVKRILPKKD